MENKSEAAPFMFISIIYLKTIRHLCSQLAVFSFHFIGTSFSGWNHHLKTPSHTNCVNNLLKCSTINWKRLTMLPCFRFHLGLSCIQNFLFWNETNGHKMHATITTPTATATAKHIDAQISSLMFRELTLWSLARCGGGAQSMQMAKSMLYSNDMPYN